LSEPSSLIHRLPTTVFLDRDGVINRKRPSGSYVESWEQFEFLPGAMDALRMLSEAGMRIVVVTNQRGVALGRMTLAAVDQIHRRMREQVALNGAEISAVLVCPHETGTCDCRKPDLGLFRQAEALFSEIEFESSAVIGDSASDLLPGNRLGAEAFFVGDEARLRQIRKEHPELRIAGSAPSLLEVATRWLDPSAQD
jgi:D-glycero-D-manno-heptose 1,7-bisphosphate phosphatase